MKGLNQIEREANTLLTSALQEQNSVTIPAIGKFQPLFHPEYILIDEGANESSRKLIPPHISLSYTPSEYILQHRHYTTIDFTPPLEYFDTAFISNLSDLYEHDEAEVTSSLTDHLRELLTDLFRGRRTTLLELGDLYITEEGDNNLLINFVASEEILKSLNFVFSAYQPVEINPSVTYPDTEIRTEIHEDKVIQVSIPKEEKKAPVIEQPLEPQVISSENDEDEKKPEEVSPLPQLSSDSIPTDAEKARVDDTDSKRDKKRRKSRHFILVGLGLCIMCIGIFQFYQNKKHRAIEDNQTIATIEKENAESAPLVDIEAPNEVPPLDKIIVEHGTTLAKLSRAYYDNNSFFWVYIYIANHDKIEDPDNLEIGQQLIIPSLSKYNLYSDPKRANQEAKEWASLILLNTFTSYEEQRPTLPMNKND